MTLFKSCGVNLASFKAVCIGKTRRSIKDFVSSFIFCLVKVISKFFGPFTS